MRKMNKFPFGLRFFGLVLTFAAALYTADACHAATGFGVGGSSGVGGTSSGSIDCTAGNKSDRCPHWTRGSISQFKQAYDNAYPKNAYSEPYACYAPNDPDLPKGEEGNNTDGVVIYMGYKQSSGKWGIRNYTSRPNYLSAGGFNGMKLLENGQDFVSVTNGHVSELDTPFFNSGLGDAHLNVIGLTDNYGKPIVTYQNLLDAIIGRNGYTGEGVALNNLAFHHPLHGSPTTA